MELTRRLHGLTVFKSELKPGLLILSMSFKLKGFREEIKSLVAFLFLLS